MPRPCNAQASGKALQLQSRRGELCGPQGVWTPLNLPIFNRGYNRCKTKPPNRPTAGPWSGEKPHSILNNLGDLGRFYRAKRSGHFGEGGSHPSEQ